LLKKVTHPEELLILDSNSSSSESNPRVPSNQNVPFKD